MAEIWLLYAFSAMIIWGFIPIVDKFVLTKHLSSYSYCIISLPVTIAVIVGILLLMHANLTISFIPMVAGIIAVDGYYLYAYAMRREEASRIVALTSLYPVFVAALAALLIHESFS